MQQFKHILIYGFAIFSMFFGSGNLVFPIQIGYSAGSNWLEGFLGLLITGILLPFLGLFVIKIYRGNYNIFFCEAGGLAGKLIPLITLSLLGSFAVVPRCIIVAYGSLEFIFPNTSLISFSFIFCLIIFGFCIKEKLMINILGKWMSPILLIILSFLIIIGFINANPIETGSDTAFKDGFLAGYQTMDLFAAFFFSAFIFEQIQNKLSSKTTDRKIIFTAIKSSILGASILSIIYLGFIYLGAHYSFLLKDTSPEAMLSAIANNILGKNSTIFVSIAIFLSCLTTAIALTNIYSKYICSLVKPKEVENNFILVITILAAFLVSLLDFNGIANFLAPILETIYPSLIILTILCICTRSHKSVKIISFYGIILLMLFDKLS